MRVVLDAWSPPRLVFFLSFRSRARHASRPTRPDQEPCTLLCTLHPEPVTEHGARFRVQGWRLRHASRARRLKGSDGKWGSLEGCRLPFLQESRPTRRSRKRNAPAMRAAMCALAKHSRRALARNCGRKVDVRLPGLPWREAGPPNHHDDKVDSDQ